MLAALAEIWQGTDPVLLRIWLDLLSGVQDEL
jgi:hypothetical protein